MQYARGKKNAGWAGNCNHLFARQGRLSLMLRWLQLTKIIYPKHKMAKIGFGVSASVIIVPLYICVFGEAWVLWG